jgi:PPR repeat
LKSSFRWDFFVGKGTINRLYESLLITISIRKMDLIRRVGSRKDRSIVALRVCACLDPHAPLSTAYATVSKRNTSYLASKRHATTHKRQPHARSSSNNPWRIINRATFSNEGSTNDGESSHSDREVVVDTNSVLTETLPGQEAMGLTEQQSESYDVNALEEDTAMLLNEEACPIGSLDMQGFDTMRKLLFSWTDLSTPISVERSLALMDRLVEEQKLNFHHELAGNTINQFLNVGTLNALVKNWCNCWTNAERSELLVDPDALLQRIEGWSQEYPGLAPRTATMSSIMHAIVVRIQNVADAQYVESLLVKMEQESTELGNMNMAPTIVEYNIAMNAMAKVKEAEHAEAIFRRVYDNYVSKKSPLKPDYVSCATILYAWKDSGQVDAGERAEAIMDGMIELGYRDGDPLLALPSAQSYYSCLKAWCTPKTEYSLEQAERFLQRMRDDLKAGNEQARPTAFSYGLVLNNWAQLGRGEQCERVLRTMHNDFAHNHNMHAKPTNVHFNMAISAWIRSGSITSLSRAFALYENMKHMNIQPDKVTYGTLLFGLSRSNDPSIGEESDRLFNEQLERYKEGDETCKPDARDYNVAMHCWSTVGNAKRVVALLHELVLEHKKGKIKITDDRPFCTALAALSRSRDPNAIGQAEAIFHLMNNLCAAGVLDFQPSAAFYVAMQGCWASAELPLVSGQKCLSLLQEMQRKYRGGDETMRPSEAHFKTAIDAFARTNSPHEAEEVWSLMFQSFLDGNQSAKPGSESCKAILCSWLKSNSPDAIERTLELMDRMSELDRLDDMGLKLHMKIYHLLLDICSKSSNTNVLVGAEAVLRKMKEIHSEGNGAVAPDTWCYNVAINCWRKSGNAERAEALFWEMFRGHSEEAKEDVKPDDISVSTVLSAWSKSGNEHAVRRAEVYFERIQKLMKVGKLPGVTLDSVCYAALLHCLGKAGTEEAADSAEAAFTDLQRRYRRGDTSARPSESCYHELIRCLTQVGRLERSEDVLLEMCELFMNGRADLAPKVATCSLVLTGWLTSSALKAPEGAERMLRFMDQNVQSKEIPDALNFSSVLRFWAKSRRPESGERAEQLLLEMTKRFGSNRPLVKTCFSDLVCAWARCGGTERAEKLLLRMCDDFKQRRSDIKPDLRAFISVLAALSRSQPSALGVRCVRLVDNLRDIASSGKDQKSNKVLDCWNMLPREAEDRLPNFLRLMEEYDAPTDTRKGPDIDKSAESFSFAFKF